MAIMPILVAPHPRLKSRALKVAKVDREISTLMADMAETMYSANGIGLAAPQVGVLKRVIVVDVSTPGERGGLIKMANPEIIWQTEETEKREEGCLSLPDQFAEVERPVKIKVRYLDQQNEIREMDAGGMLAVCIQHEMDHLDGTLFVDHLSQLRRKMIMRKLEKNQKLAAAK